MATTWWPELTIDALQADLRSDLQAFDDQSLDDWQLVDRPNVKRPNVWDVVKERIFNMEKRIALIRFSLCMAVFHTLHAEYDPLEFLDPIDSTCIDISHLVCEHVPDEDQDAKDIARDSLIIHHNVKSRPLLGAQLGYTGVLGILCESVPSHVAKLCLSLSSRTFSGGVAFDNVLKFFPDVVPLSAEAEPIDLLVGDAAVWIRAHTKFAIGDSTKAVNAFTMVRVSLQNDTDRKGFVLLEEVG